MDKLVTISACALSVMAMECWVGAGIVMVDGMYGDKIRMMGCISEDAGAQLECEVIHR